MIDHPYLLGSEVVTELDDLAQYLQNTSRVTPNPSAAKRIFTNPVVLDYLERLVFADRGKE